MTPPTGTAADRAARLVLRWARLYTRGLSPELAADRREELAADLDDQIAAQRDAGAGERATAAGVLARALRGALDDLLWRRAALTASLSPAVRWAGAGLLGAALGLGVALESIAVVTLERVVRGAADAGLPITLVAALGGACGLVLLLRSRTRWLGALWMLVTTQLVIWDTTTRLADTTTTLALFAAGDPAWTFVRTAAASGIALFFLAAAAWWAPGRRTGAA